jgi:transcriptional regulator with XRE-family HTH domain
VLSEQIGHLIKAKRASRGLKQEDLARDANVARDVISRLEQGRAPAVQADTFDKLCLALGVKLHVYEHDLSRQLARQQQQRVVDHRRERHLRLAIDLATGGARDRIVSAKAQVSLWRQRKLCSAFYIRKWSKVLALPPKEMARAMASFGEWEAAMFQNSPWI